MNTIKNNTDRIIDAFKVKELLKRKVMTSILEYQKYLASPNQHKLLVNETSYYELVEIFQQEIKEMIDHRLEEVYEEQDVEYWRSLKKTNKSDT